MKKRTVNFLMLVIFSLLINLLNQSAYCQSPSKMSYQAVIRNTNNALVKSAKIGMKITVLKGSENGAVVFSQTIQDSTNSNGLISAQIGGSGFEAIDWSTGVYFVKTETDPLGGSNYTITSNQQMLSVPYALYAEKSGSVGPKGDKGEPGISGTNGKTTLLKMAKEALGSNCPNGGIRVEAGLDVNGNGLLEPSEVLSSLTKYICNGLNGIMPEGKNEGEMQYWNGKEWVMVAPGTKGQTLTFCDGKPLWGACPIVLPKLTTSSASFITTSTAISGGKITDDGGANVTARGICFNTSPNPNISNFKTSDGNGIGSFTSTLSGLISNTTYYARAYATNSAGTGYGTEVSFNTSSPQVLSVGQAYQGGVIAYILQAGDMGYDASLPHGLIAAPADQSVGIQWYNGNDLETGATAVAIGTGNDNTKAIVAIQGLGNYAASLCADLELNGFTDWYLPSKEELNKLFLNKGLIGGFAINYYWSSSESSYNEAWIQSFNLGSQSSLSKFSPNYVRAVRAF